MTLGHMLNDAQQPADYDYCFVYIMLFSPTQILNLNTPIFKLKCSDTSQKVIKMLGEKGVTAEYPCHLEFVTEQQRLRGMRKIVKLTHDGKISEN